MKALSEIRKRLTGEDTAPYVGYARKLLGELKAQMAYRGLQQYQWVKDLPNGVRVMVSSVFGNDEIQISTIAPPTSNPPPLLIPSIPPVVQPELLPLKEYLDHKWYTLWVACRATAAIDDDNLLIREFDPNKMDWTGRQIKGYYARECLTFGHDALWASGEVATQKVTVRIDMQNLAKATEQIISNSQAASIQITQNGVLCVNTTNVVLYDKTGKQLASVAITDNNGTVSSYLVDNLLYISSQWGSATICRFNDGKGKESLSVIGSADDIYNNSSSPPTISYNAAKTSYNKVTKEFVVLPYWEKIEDNGLGGSKAWSNHDLGVTGNILNASYTLKENSIRYTPDQVDFFALKDGGLGGFSCAYLPELGIGLSINGNAWYPNWDAPSVPLNIIRRWNMQPNTITSSVTSEIAILPEPAESQQYGVSLTWDSGQKVWGATGLGFFYISTNGNFGTVSRFNIPDGNQAVAVQPHLQIITRDIPADELVIKEAEQQIWLKKRVLELQEASVR